ncbi:RES family NAD+ phosphorylase [Mucilaginibacter sp. RS28]|uniref:RES family NAD+ phosphorylase n=1 Tax=Mucilaginibacter straminoryzae TaxID=2932774 RepID=A0A9X1X4E8_9SPHI|nr:RES family NAD+ phosphorylase [Mucilaginibacter straminoryzae]MCJ8210185.1 RES family NAD+ phosphorylase [Mucilaginibacter straminoryzae]
MLVYRIALTKYAHSLVASGRAGRWNPNDTNVIYTSGSRSLACLENVVHRSQLGLTQLFNVMTIEVSEKLKKDVVQLNDLPFDWKNFHQMPFTQHLGQKWLNAGRTALLQIPSSIIPEEVNILLNPAHPDFKHIHLVSSDSFVFDARIKS